ncbi:hypothetical protein AM493_01360 [Flavobacterium akiainvivens]|uniref:GLPGLI family protein n=1 Tax=Flavobacterium akiainvivens TaxID=1202724 RepID=A0A0M8MEY0_9FLAO|nr:GLPGLI family protein [Flavobacterium akiainvivens]KOS04841.1 hypothetical protein AM493_01360 [Flavobacterium akiainvivens]SFQ43423.1 GLPGLI family protein [Flavobacterium akiainvivens]
MKKRLLVTGIAVLLACTAHAQDIYGTVTYTSKLTSIELGEDILAETPPDMVEETKASVIEAAEETYTLQFDNASSYYKKVENPAQELSGMLVISAGSFNAQHYMNLKDNKAIMQLTILDETYLLTNTPRDITWKQENEVKQIAGYTCKKATYLRPEDNTTVTAWYTPDIPVSLGPEGYYGLPGLILEINEGNAVLQCTAISLNTGKKPVITPPATGRKVTKEELLDILSKKQSEFEPVIQEVPSNKNR